MTTGWLWKGRELLRAGRKHTTPAFQHTKLPHMSPTSGPASGLRTAVNQGSHSGWETEVPRAQDTEPAALELNSSTSMGEAVSALRSPKPQRQGLFVTCHVSVSPTSPRGFNNTQICNRHRRLLLSQDREEIYIIAEYGETWKQYIRTGSSSA